MTPRKPPGQGWESWIERQIREAAERGEFDRLPGAGRPLPDLDEPFDQLRWVKRKLEREGLTYQPPSVALRREAHEALEEAVRAGSEAEVRRQVEEINERIRAANRRWVPGPSLPLRPFDVERVVGEWRQRRERERREAGRRQRQRREPDQRRPPSAR